MHFSHVIFLYLADLIFLIYLYQRWAYPVDKTRVNEFGFGGEDDQASSGEVTPAKEEEKKTNWANFLSSPLELEHITKFIGYF